MVYANSLGVLQMNQLEKKLLSETIKGLIRHNSYLWWELKKEADSFGYQTSFPRQFEYEQPAKTFIKKLPAGKKVELFNEAIKRQQPNNLNIEEFLQQTYVLEITEEIGRRAEIAARRTVNW